MIIFFAWILVELYLKKIPISFEQQCWLIQIIYDDNDGHNKPKTCILKNVTNIGNLLVIFFFFIIEIELGAIIHLLKLLLLLFVDIFNQMLLNIQQQKQQQQNLNSKYEI